MSAASLESPLPPESWWSAVSEGRILLLQCKRCDAAWLPWMPHCPDCGSGSQTTTIEASGRGTLYSWVVVHSSQSCPDEVPFTVAAVRLDEGAVLYGRLRSGAVPVADAPVRAGFVEREGRTVIDFGLLPHGEVSDGG